MKAYIKYQNNSAALNVIVKTVAAAYRDCRMQIDVYEATGKVEENRKDYDEKKQFVVRMEKALPYCSKPTRNIIQHEVFEPYDPKWYIPYYSTSSYYRHRQKAYVEFLRCLDI